MGRLWRYLLPGACGVVIGTASLWAMNRAPTVDSMVGAGEDWPTGTIYKDRLILGTAGNTPGDVRAYALPKRY